MNIIGQNKAKTILQGFCNSVVSTGAFPSPVLICGAAGVGKTHLSKTLAGELEKSVEARILRVSAASEFARSDSPAMGEFIQALKDSVYGVKTVIMADEGHTLPLNPMVKNPSPSERVFNSLIYGAGEQWGKSGELEFLGEGVSFNARNIGLFLLTNHPERIGNKQNRDAIARRFLRVNLERYTDAEMKKIIPAFFNAKGVKVTADAGKMLIKMHRGTCEALDDFLKKAAGHYVEIIDKEIMEKVLPLCEFTLRGFRVSEIAAMRWLATTTEPRRIASVTLHFPGLDTGEFFRHGKRQTTKNGKGEIVETPFITLDAKNQFSVTDAGSAFLRKYRSLFDMICA